MRHMTNTLEQQDEPRGYKCPITYDVLRDANAIGAIGLHVGRNLG